MSGSSSYFEADMLEYEKILAALKEQLQAVDTLYQITSSTQNQPSIAQFLRAKNALMAKYLTFLNFYVLQKLKYGTLDDFPLDQLLQPKVLMQKMAQTQKKLQYQIDKLTKVEQLQEQPEDEVERMALKPRIDNLVLQEDKATPSQKEKYVPPKLAATLSQADKIKERQAKREELKKQQQKAQLIRSVIGGADADKPREIGEKEYQEIYYGRAEDERQKEKRLHEEQIMARLPTTKKEKIRERIAERKAQSVRLDDFEGFEVAQKAVEGKKKKIQKLRVGGKKPKGSLKKFLKNKKKRH